jgi:tetratricopeptide (TPR) repeat protein
MGQTTPNVATNLNNLAALLQATNRLAEAEPLMRRALEIDEKSYGSGPPEGCDDRPQQPCAVAASHEPSGGGRAADAAGAGDRREELRKPDHPKVAIRLNNLAQLLQDTNRLAEAEPLMRRALEIDEKSYGSDHPVLPASTTLRNCFKPRTVWRRPSR